MAEKKDGTVTVEVEKRLEDLFREDGESFDFLEDSSGSEDPSSEDLEMSPDFLEDTGEFKDTPPRELDESSGFMEDSSVFERSPLKELKTIVLSIDWEINDEDMTRFIEQVETLKQTYVYDKVALLLLQILDALGRYVKTNKGNAHPNAVKVLNSVYTSLEKVLLQKDITDAEKEKVLLVEVQRFKELKEQVSARETSVDEKKEAKKPLEMKPEIKGNEKDVALPEVAKPHEKAMEKVPLSDMSHMPPHEAFAYALEEIKHVLKSEFKALRAELKLWREGQ